MKFFIASLAFLPIFLGAGIQAHCEEVYGDVLVSRLVSVYDGDTIMVDLECYPSIIGRRISVRVFGIDTPEIKSKNPTEREKALEARDVALTILSEAHQIILKNIRRGKYFRLVADVYADGLNLADILLQRRLAQTYTGGTKKPWQWENN